jgi:ABC-type enterochelin transport system substrate-binding protein
MNIFIPPFLHFSGYDMVTLHFDCHFGTVFAYKPKLLFFRGRARALVNQLCRVTPITTIVPSLLFITIAVNKFMTVLTFI